MLISFSRKFIFIHNPKAAGTSVKKVLVRYQPMLRNLLTLRYQLHNDYIIKVVEHIPEKFKNDYIKSLGILTHASALKIKNLLSEDLFTKFFKFGFVRNPWDLEVSLYFYICSNKNHKEHNIVKKLKNFDEYLEWRCFQYMSQQKEVFYDENGNKLVDFIGKFENLNEDFQYITEQIGIKFVKLPHKNKSNHKNYRTYYNDHTCKLMQEYFKNDIELFGYEF